jgi:hypothetical protein
MSIRIKQEVLDKKYADGLVQIKEEQAAANQ